MSIMEIFVAQCGQFLLIAPAVCEVVERILEWNIRVKQKQ